MESLPSLPSTSGDTGCSPYSCGIPDTHLSDNESVISPITDASSSAASPTSSQIDEIAIVDRLNQEIEDLRSAWLIERNHYLSTQLELNRLQKIVEACDASYRCLDYYHSLDPRAALSEIATTVIERWADNKERIAFEHAEKQMKEREANIKDHCRQFFRANRIFSDVATNYYKEIERYAMWTVTTASKLRADYIKYCRIAKERGQEPEILYEQDAMLEDMQQNFYSAWDARNIATRKAMEAAHLDGHPNMLDNLFGN